MGFAVGWTIFLVVILLAGNLLGDDRVIVTLSTFSMMAFFTLLIYLNLRPVWDYVYSSHKREGVLEAVEAALGVLRVQGTSLEPGVRGPDRRPPR